MTDGAEVVRLIHTRLLRRGKGTEDDPVRIIDQWWTLDGELVVERDGWLEDASGLAHVERFSGETA